MPASAWAGLLPWGRFGRERAYPVLQPSDATGADARAPALDRKPRIGTSRLRGFDVDRAGRRGGRQHGRSALSPAGRAGPVARPFARQDRSTGPILSALSPAGRAGPVARPFARQDRSTGPILSALSPAA